MQWSYEAISELKIIYFFIIFSSSFELYKLLPSTFKNIIIGPYLAIFLHFLLQKLLITHFIQYAKHIY